MANLFATVIVFGSVPLICKSAYTTPTAFGVEDVSAPAVSQPQTITAADVPRDIYYLVFDGYANSRTLSEEFNFDNSPFLDSLRRRGFVIAEQSYANYPKTDLSMAAALNMQYHGESIGPKSQYLTMLQDHRVGRLLQQQGYEYHHFGCLLDGLRHNRIADANYKFSTMPTEYTDILFQFTAFYPMFPTINDRQRVLDKFDQLRDIPRRDGPSFVYAHFVVPQPPWKFDRDGSPPSVHETAARTNRQNYINQLVYTNQRVGQLVDQILTQSATPPIIIIHADEGPELRYDIDRSSDPAARIRKRCGVTTAYHFPDRDAADMVPQGMSPVNMFRLIFREYFSADVALLPDRYFYWDPPNYYGKPELTKPCRFVDVTDLLLESGNLVQ